jgi:hypothetical protein
MTLAVSSGIIVITAHHIRTANENFAVDSAMRISIPSNTVPIEPTLLIFGTIHARHAGFSHSVTLQNRNARRPKCIRKFAR